MKNKQQNRRVQPKISLLAKFQLSTTLPSYFFEFQKIVTLLLLRQHGRRHHHQHQRGRVVRSANSPAHFFSLTQVVNLFNPIVNVNEREKKILPSFLIVVINKEEEEEEANTDNITMSTLWPPCTSLSMAHT